MEDEEGRVTDLSSLSRARREKIARELLVPSAALVAAQSATAAKAGTSAAAATLLGGAATGASVAALPGTVPTAFAPSEGHLAPPPVQLSLDPGAAGAAAAAGARSSGGTGVKRVYRHLMDDDIVLMNRQPSLHKPSMMAHR